MRIHRLRMVNYRRHRDTFIEFPDGVTAIVGRNGSGKTTILEAIAFALYGTPAARTQKALLRHDQAPPSDPVRVELEAELAGQAIHVVRELRGTHLTGVASLVIDGHTIVAPQAGSGEAVTEEVTKRLGLDREAFFNTVFAQQKEVGRLAQKTKAERKRLILGMLGIDALDRAIQEAGTLRRAAETRVQTLQERLPDMKAAQEEHARCQQAVIEWTAKKEAAASRWESARHALAAAAARLEKERQEDARRREAVSALDRALQEERHAHAQVEALRQQVAEAQQAAQEAAALAASAAELPDARDALEQAIAAEHAKRRAEALRQEVARLELEVGALHVPAPNGLLEVARTEVAAAAAAVEDHQVQVTVVATQLQAVVERLERLEGVQGACPVCEQPVADAGALREHLRQEQARRARDHAALGDALADARRRLAAKQGELEALQAAQRRHEEAQAARRRIEEVLGRTREEQRIAEAACPPGVHDLATLRQRVQQAEAATMRHARAEGLASRLPALHGSLNEAQARHVEASRRAQAAQALLADLPPSALAEAEGAHVQASKAEREEERAYRTVESQAQLAAQASVVSAQRVDEAREAAAALATAMQSQREWQALAGVRGQGLLDRFRSHLVARIGPAVAAEASRLLSRFTAGRYDEIALDEDYEIYVCDQGVRYQLERFSGGETDIVNLALRLAVSRLLVERTGGAEIRFLALDEVFGSLDADRRGLVLQALQELGTLYSQVLLVTHEDLQDALDSTLVVEDLGAEAAVHMHNG